MIRHRALFFSTLILPAALVAHEPDHRPKPAGSQLAPAARPISLPAGWSESAPRLAPGSFAPAIATDGERLLATWIEPPAGADPRSNIRFAVAHGTTWKAPVTVRASAELFANWADTPGMIAADDGTILVWWLEKSASATYAYDVRLARSTDRGATFVELGVLHDDRSPVEHGFVSAVAIGGDAVRFFYLDGRATAKGGAMQLRSVVVTGAAIGPSVLLDDSVCDCCPTAATRTGGGAAAIYRDRSPTEVRDIRVVRMGDRSLPVQSAVADDGWKIDGCPVNGPAIATDSGSTHRLGAAWFSAPEDRGRVAFASSLDGGQTFSPRRILDDAKPLGRVAIASVPEGFAVAWLARLGATAELRLANVGEGGAAPAAPAPLALARTEPGRESGMPRLARVGDRLWVSWSEAQPRGLRFASSSLSSAGAQKRKIAGAERDSSRPAESSATTLQE